MRLLLFQTVIFHDYLKTMLCVPEDQSLSFSLPLTQIFTLFSGSVHLLPLLLADDPAFYFTGKRNEACGGASIDFPSLILITPSSAPSLQPKEGVGLLGSESCAFLPSQRSLCAKYHTSSPSWDFFSLGTFPQAHKHAQVSHVLKTLQSFLIHVFFNYWSFHSPIHSLNKL